MCLREIIEFLSRSFISNLSKKRVKVKGYPLRVLMSLYRKHRPKDFPSLVGQDHIKITLLNAIKAGQVSHAYLFTGPRGTGKTTTARLLAKAINVETMSEDGRFDGSELAEEIDHGRLIDVIEIDAASNRGIDEIRDLREKINYSPTRAKNKVYIIDEVHMLTKEAFNALLKTLEEPPSFVYFILATTEIHKVPETIISRCQRFDFRRITEADLVARLKVVATAESVQAEEEALQIIARQARGGLRDAISLFEQLITDRKVGAERAKQVLGISNWGAAEELFALLMAGDAAGGVKKLEEIFAAGGDLTQFNRDFLDFLRKKLLDSVKQNDYAETGRNIQLIGYFQEAYEKLKFSYIPELPLEIAIVKACLEKGGNNTPTSASQIDVGSKKKPELEKPLEKPVDLLEKSEETPIIQPIVATDSADLTLDDLIQRWSNVFDRMPSPLAKRCLKSAKLVEANSATITLAFSSNFNKDKLFVQEILVESEKAIAEEYGRNFKLSGIIDPAVFSTSNGSFSNESPAETAESPEQSIPKKADRLRSALDVFGGEILD